MKMTRSPGAVHPIEPQHGPQNAPRIKPTDVDAAHPSPTPNLPSLKETSPPTWDAKARPHRSDATQAPTRSGDWALPFEPWNFAFQSRLRGFLWIRGR